MDPITALNQSLDLAGSVVKAVTPDQMGSSTPCTEFDVRALLNHMTGAISALGTGLTGGTPDMTMFSTDLIGNDPAAVFESAASATRAAATPESLNATVNMPFGPVPGVVAVSVGTLEALVHGWDLARATGQHVQFDHDLAETGIEMAKGFPPDLVRSPGVWGAEVECDAAAPAGDRLAAYLGRTV